MTKFFALSAALLLSSTPSLAATAPTAATPPPQPPVEQQVRCSIVFALVAQQRLKVAYRNA